MNLTIDRNDLRRVAEGLKQLPKLVRDIVMDNLTEAALFAMGKIRIWMPKDTGTAMNSWGNRGLGGSFKIDHADLSVTMGGVHYIEYLNEGHSKQAPSGFIDSILQQAIDAFITGLNRARLAGGIL